MGRLNVISTMPLFGVPGQQPWAEPDGRTYERAKDMPRLGRQAARVFNLMQDGRWRTLGDISHITCAPESSASARLRDFRKPKFGLHVVNRRRRTERGGTFEYQLIPKEKVI